MMVSRSGVPWQWAVTGCLMLAAAGEAVGVDTYQTRDTLAVVRDRSVDAQAMIEQLTWRPCPFKVTCEPEPRAEYDRLVRFPSPVSTGDDINDRVALEWRMARDADGKLIRAPAVIVVHESGSAMPVGRLFAKSLQQYGMHTFLIHLPGYGKRRHAGRPPSGRQLLLLIHQAVADVRRARDAITVLPNVDSSHISLQGTSLGGFVVAISASLDGCFDSVFIMLAGGDLYNMITNGEKDTAGVRRELAKAGYTGSKLKELTWRMEPTRLAHRLDPRKTWLYSARYDKVVPMASALALAHAAKLDGDHHLKFWGNHYTTIVYLPIVLAHVVEQVTPQSAASK